MRRGSGASGEPPEGASGGRSGRRDLKASKNDLCSTKNAPAACRQSLEPWARLKFHARWSDRIRPSASGEGLAG